MKIIRSIKKKIGPRSKIRLYWHACKALLAAAMYGFPAKKLEVVGITGTDGKTTTVSMVGHILRKNNYKVAVLSTAFSQIDSKYTWNKTQKTSPSPLYIQKFLKDAVTSGCTHAVLEVSSHGLVQNRLLCTWPKVAAITQISPEHLDYHGTMEQYIKDKGVLFAMLKNSGTKVLNYDDQTMASYSLIPSNTTITYSTGSPYDTTIKEGTSIKATNIAADYSTISAEVEFENANYELNLPIAGSYNIENALCAVSCSHSIGISMQKSIAALEHFMGVPGRMESIDEGQDFFVFVDFTVTPSAYTKTLSTLRSMINPNNKILVLTGSCGDRMKEKRPLVGSICSELADVVVVTNEDPYTEDPQQIIDQVWEGVDQNACEAHQIFDRKEAIKFIFSKASPGDAVILCAKGSDTTMWVAEGQIPWNEREIAKELLQQNG